MTGGAVGSLFAQFLRLTADERKTLLVAGAAGGMAATFNSPVRRPDARRRAAAVRVAAAQLCAGRRRRRASPPIVRRPLLGTAALFPAARQPAPHVRHLRRCASSPASRPACSPWSRPSSSTPPRTRSAACRVHWMWWPAIGGLIIGARRPDRAAGARASATTSSAPNSTGSIGLGLVVGILVVKTLIWSLSLGSGTSGGVLAPMFMIGGALGTLEAHVFPAVGPGFWALIGLAGVLGGVMRSPFTGVVFAVELTHRFDAVLPLIIGAIDGVRRLRAAAQALGPHREDRPPRLPPVPRVRRRPAGDPVRRRGDGDATCSPSRPT